MGLDDAPDGARRPFGIGDRALRIEDPRLVTGGGRYVDDLPAHRAAHGFVLRSPIAHGRITGIDASAARAAAGVLAVLTAEEYVSSGLDPLPCAVKSPHNLKDRSDFFPVRAPLAADKTRFVGDPVAFIVAETRDQARAAAELIEIDLDPLDAVIATADAPSSASVAVWQGCPDNVCFVHEVGDRQAVERAMGSAAHRVVGSFEIPRIAISPMEPRGVLVEFDPRGELFTVNAGVQDVYNTRRLLAQTFNEPEGHFRVVSPDVGGSFGIAPGPSFQVTPRVDLRSGELP